MKGIRFVPHRLVQFAPGRFGQSQNPIRRRMVLKVSLGLRARTAWPRRPRPFLESLPLPDSLGADIDFCSVAIVARGHLTLRQVIGNGRYLREADGRSRRYAQRPSMRRLERLKSPPIPFADLPPNLRCGLVGSEPNINRVSQEPIASPGQIGAHAAAPSSSPPRRPQAENRDFVTGLLGTASSRLSGRSLRRGARIP